ncbi:MAG: hypothetical protein V3V31_00365 [Methylococcales bacterium]
MVKLRLPRRMTLVDGEAKDMGETNLYQQLERIGNLLRMEVRKIGAKTGLQLVHLQALLSLPMKSL